METRIKPQLKLFIFKTSTFDDCFPVPYYEEPWGLNARMFSCNCNGPLHLIIYCILTTKNVKLHDYRFI